MVRYRYPWPASAITTDDMAILHAVRESSLPRLPITALIAIAVRKTYAEQASVLNLPAIQVTHQDLRKAA